MPSIKTRDELGPVLVDVSHLKSGQQMTVLWRRKPVWIIHRTVEMLSRLSESNALLRYPESKVLQQPSYATNSYRSIKPEYLVLVGICTHLGCTPLYKPNQCDASTTVCGEFYCPCHGSRFDLAGRVFKQAPAPINLEVPPYRFIDEHLIEIGEAV
jgi:ubiquinol-cytochrome c reductase iron-sulfur subunit